MLRRVILLCLGFGALGMGAVGVLLPVLPTTPFVLCAAGCFGASSPRLYSALASTRVFGEYIRNYKSKTGISTAARLAGLLFLWAMLILSALFAASPLITGILALVGFAVSLHLLALRAAPT